MRSSEEVWKELKEDFERLDIVELNMMLGRLFRAGYELLGERKYPWGPLRFVGTLINLIMTRIDEKYPDGMGVAK